MTRAITTVARRDDAYIGDKNHHYIIGSKNSPISGGLYVDKKVDVPSEITIIIRKEGD
jgi:hypothetical protein